MESPRIESTDWGKKAGPEVQNMFDSVERGHPSYYEN